MQMIRDSNSKFIISGILYNSSFYLSQSIRSDLNLCFRLRFFLCSLLVIFLKQCIIILLYIFVFLLALLLSLHHIWPGLKQLSNFVVRIGAYLPSLMHVYLLTHQFLWLLHIKTYLEIKETETLPKIVFDKVLLYKASSQQHIISFFWCVIRFLKPL